MNYQAVAPPEDESKQNNASFQDALARARQIAAKFGQGDGTPSNKRPYDGSDSPDNKKFAVQPQMMPAMQPPANPAAAAAAAAAAAINAKLGLPTQNPPPQVGGFKTEPYQVPDRMVGLIIGKGGEQIAAIQAETGVKVQFAQDSGGMADRPCTLTGPAEGIVRAREIINKIIAKGSGMPDCGFGEGSMLEIMVPGSKVGLVIGKGGETIKMLQERAGVKMVMIQDSNIPTMEEKPLRITGDPSKCQHARELVLELINQKDSEGHGGFGEYGQGSRSSQEIQVPRSVVGVIIGKQGDMIKRIQAETGAKVQFTPDDGSPPERTCLITGAPESVNKAAQHVKDLVAHALNRPGQPGAPRGGGGYGGDYGGYGATQETTFDVPADKCGLIIGKGGETIKQIAQASGAKVELSRGPDPAPNMKTFNIKGTQQSIDDAINMIKERIDQRPYFDQQGGYGQGGYGQEWGQQNYWEGQSGGGGDKQSQDANAAAWAAYYQQQQQQQQQPQQPAQGGPGAPGAQNGQQGAPPGGAPAQGGQPDYSLQWAEYYRSQGMHYHAQAILAQGGHSTPGQGQPDPPHPPQGPPTS